MPDPPTTPIDPTEDLIPAWWALDPEDALARLAVDRAGLSEAEADERRRRFGPNRLPAREGASVLQTLLHQFASPLIAVLLAAMVVTLLIEQWADAIVIGIVLVINAVVGFSQEHRAENAIWALLSMVAPSAIVRRAGRRRQVPAAALVPGDIVQLESGDIVPADLRLLEVTGLYVDESTLTGESEPVLKQVETPIGGEALPVADRVNAAFMGTTVTAGRALAVVVATGISTEIGGVAEEIRATPRPATPLQERTARLAWQLTAAVLVGSVISFAVGLARGESVAEMFLVAVAVAVSAMPEGLPVVMTIALAVSVRRMAARKAIVRRLPAVETLGSCTVIATDKTGTLTENRMTATTIVAGGVSYTLTGVGAAPGRVEHEGRPVTVAPGSPLYAVLEAGVLNNEAEVNSFAGGDGPETVGDPMEVALLIAARKAGIDWASARTRRSRVGAIPFEAQRRFSAIVQRASDGDTAVLVKGAPEKVLAMCATERTSDGEEPLDRGKSLEEAELLAASGRRVLAFAAGRGEATARSLEAGACDDLVFLGLVAMLDPPRPDVAEAVARCDAAGIRVIMVTGDHAATATAVAEMVGLASRDEPEAVCHGRDIETMTDDELDSALRDVVVFARISPAQKLRIVDRLRARGEVVAVTGDGVNDAPALKSADIGAAMGQSGTAVAREASEMVLVDDNFATVYAAVEEGRTAFANIRKAAFYLISSGVAELLAILGSLAAGSSLPFRPAQILWLNVVTNGIQDVGLALEPAERHLLEEPPRPVREGLLTRVLVVRTLLVGMVMAAGTLAVFGLELSEGAGLDYAQVAALTMMVVFQTVHVGNCRSETISAFRRSVFSNPFLLLGSSASMALHIGAMYAPPTQALLGLEPLTMSSWLRIAVFALAVLIVVELHKLVVRRSSPPMENRGSSPATG